MFYCAKEPKNLAQVCNPHKRQDKARRLRWDNDFNRPSGTEPSLHRFPGTSCLATINRPSGTKTFLPSKGQKASKTDLNLAPFNPGLCFLDHFGPRMGRLIGAKQIQNPELNGATIRPVWYGSRRERDFGIEPGCSREPPA